MVNEPLALVPSIGFGNRIAADWICGRLWIVSRTRW